MITLSESRQARLLVFPTLYVAQGLPWGFVSVGYGVLLADAGLDATAIGAALGLAYLPWSFKVLWGPLLDAVPPLAMGRRRPFLLVAQVLMGFTLLALTTIDPAKQLAAASAMIFLNNTFASLQDVSTDALAVDLLQDDERGRVNALMWAGKLGGVALGGSAGLMLAKWAGWDALFVAQAAGAWLAAGLVLLLRERPASDLDRRLGVGELRLLAFGIPFVVVGAALYALSNVEGDWVAVVQPFVAVGGALLAWPLVDRAGFAAMRGAFSTRAPWVGLVLALGTPVGYASIQAAHTRLLRTELGFSEEWIATLSAIDPVSGIAGALVGGFLADRFGARPVMAAGMSVLGAALIGFAGAGALWPSFAFMAGWTAIYFFAMAAYNAASLGLMMGLSDPKVGATQFAIYMAATNLTYAWTAPFGGSIADRFGYPALYSVAAGIQLATIALVAIPLGRGPRSGEVSGAS